MLTYNITLLIKASCFFKPTLRTLSAFTSLTHPQPPPQAGALVAFFRLRMRYNLRFCNLVYNHPLYYANSAGEFVLSKFIGNLSSSRRLSPLLSRCGYAPYSPILQLPRRARMRHSIYALQLRNVVMRTRCIAFSWGSVGTYTRSIVRGSSPV